MAVAPHHEQATDPEILRRAGYAAFVRGVGSWFGAWGMHSALFSWLLVVELQSSPQLVGFGQLAVMLPTVLLILVGGSLADRSDVRRSLMLFHVAASLGPLVLAALVANGRLTYSALLIYGVWLGVMTAFIMPARDTLLSRVAGPDMLRAVTGMTIVQFIGQAGGSFLAGAARWTGPAPMLVVQGLILAAGAWLMLRMPPTSRNPGEEARGGGSPRSTWGDILAALRTVLRDPRMRSTFLMALGVAFCFAGPFYVIFPLIVRDSFGGSVVLLSMLMMMFPLGTVAGSYWIRVRGGLHNRGPAALRSIFVGGALLGVIGLQLPFFWMATLTLVWGLVMSIFINATRTLFQEAAPEKERGRVLSIYQMALMGAGPLGSMTAGFCSAWIGHHSTLIVYATAVTLLALLLWGPVRAAEASLATGENRTASV